MALKFIKKGQEAQQAIQKADEADAEALNRPLYEQRIWMKPETSTQVTFLSGALDAEGILDVPMYWEHQLNMNGHWRNWFICTQHEEPCPICEMGGKEAQPMLVGVFMVIDHNEWETKQGEKVKDQIRLYVAKRDTFKELQKIATAKKGLIGHRFEITRENSKAPNVGNIFDFKSTMTLKNVLKQYKIEIPDIEEVLDVYKDAAALKALGFGTPGGPGSTFAGNIPNYNGGSNTAASGTSSAGESSNESYVDQL